MRPALYFTAWTLLAASPALAQTDPLVPVSQTRSVSGSANADDFVNYYSDADSNQSGDFLPFASANSGTVNPGDAYASGGGWQDSQILPDAIDATGSAFANAESYDFDWYASASGSSECEVTFTVAVHSTYTLTGSIAAYDYGSARAILRDAGQTHLAGTSAFGPAESYTLNESGVLPPGQYTLRCSAQGSCDAYGYDYVYAFGEYDVVLDLTPLSGGYCLAAPNSASPEGAHISFTGSQSLAANDFTLVAGGAIPSDFGIFYYGDSQQQVPFGDGYQCVGGSIHRLNPPQQTNGAGSATRALDFTASPAASGPGAILPGSTWNFQYWYRDNLGAGAGYNLSDGLWVQFVP